MLVRRGLTVAIGLVGTLVGEAERWRAGCGFAVLVEAGAVAVGEIGRGVAELGLGVGGGVGEGDTGTDEKCEVWELCE